MGWPGIEHLQVIYRCLTIFWGMLSSAEMHQHLLWCFPKIYIGSPTSQVPLKIQILKDFSFLYSSMAARNSILGLQWQAVIRWPVGLRNLEGNNLLTWRSVSESRGKHNWFSFFCLPAAWHSLSPDTEADMGNVWQNGVNKSPSCWPKRIPKKMESSREIKERAESDKMTFKSYVWTTGLNPELSMQWIWIQLWIWMQSLWKLKLCEVNLLKRHDPKCVWS